MATFLDLTLMDQFSSIFVVIFVFAILYAIFEWTKFLGAENKNIRAILAFTLAVLTLFSPEVINLFMVMGPLFVIVFIFIVFLIMLLKMFGATDADFTKAIQSKDKVVINWVVTIAILILIIAIGKSYGQDTLVLTNEDAERVTSSDDDYSSGSSIDLTEGTSSSSSSSDGDSFDSNVAQALFHPKVLGMILTLIICTFTLMLLTAAPKKFN